MRVLKGRLSRTVVLGVLLALGSGLPDAVRPARTELHPHLGYGLNVRSQAQVDPLFAPLGFEWLKLWEEYLQAVPAVRYPYQVLFLIDCTRRSGDLDQWGDDVEHIARAGLGRVEAYEICNEPNRVGWLRGVGDPPPPDPALYTELLQIAYERIKAADPAAIVVSAGLAPVGRIQGRCNGWVGNDCQAMDEREFARQMFLLGAGQYFDAFGYHPYGFAYPPETDPSSVSNGFAFRGAEVMHELLEQHGLGRKPVWATEFSWLRDPSDDPGYGPWVPGWCHSNEAFRAGLEWMDVPETLQADYMERAFRYADENWPWMGAMFVWNLDWYDYNWICEGSRYFSIRKDDGTTLGAPALAYHTLAAMDRRPGYFGPRLAVDPPTLVFLADVDEPGPITATLYPLNAGYRVLTWTATAATDLQATPTLAITSGLQGTPLAVVVDSTSYPTGTFTGAITVTATTTDVLNSPQVVLVLLMVLPAVWRVYLPAILRQS